MLGNQKLVKLLADIRPGGTAAGSSDIDAGDVESSGEQLFEVVAVPHAAKSVIDRHPKRKIPDPPLFSIDFARRLDEEGNAVLHPQFHQLAPLEGAGDLGGNLLGIGRG